MAARCMLCVEVAGLTPGCSQRPCRMGASPFPLPAVLRPLWALEGIEGCAPGGNSHGVPVEEASATLGL